MYDFFFKGDKTISRAGFEPGDNGLDIDTLTTALLNAY